MGKRGHATPRFRKDLSRKELQKEARASFILESVLFAALAGIVALSLFQCVQSLDSFLRVIG